MQAPFSFDATQMFMTGATTDEVWPLVRKYHYSKKMPSNIQYCFAWRGPGGLFGDYGEPLAAIIYGVPVNRNWPSDALELQRLVRRDDLNAPLSSFVAWSLRWLRANTACPFVLSYADSGKGHHGGIYQASGFYFMYESKARQDGAINKVTGEFKHGRQCNRELGSGSIKSLSLLGGDWVPAYHEKKYVYIKPMRQTIRTLKRRFGWVEKPYPKPFANCPLDDAKSNRAEPGASPGVRSKLTNGECGEVEP